MKNTILIAIVSSILFAFGCKKENNDDSNGNGNNGNTGNLYIQTVQIAITDSDATWGGYILNNGSASITTRGLCLGQTVNPDISGDIVSNDGTGEGSYQHIFTNLTAGIIYHVRAYATTSNGTSYGDDHSFKLSDKIPQVTTSPITGITQITASGGGEVISDGGSPVTDRGIVISKLPNPVYLGPQGAIQSGLGTGAFNVSIDSLWANTVYYVRAYAVNSIGVAYGNQLTFTTLASPYTIGQTYQGGVIFFIDETGMHGLICATSDQGVNIYAPQGTQFLNATGDGQYNTNLIVGIFGVSSYAAGICNSLTSGGYDDWYLPSIGELMHVYNQRALIGGFNGPDFVYWSSTDDFFNPEDAKAVSFVTGSAIIEPKSASHRVRAIRSF